MSNLRTPDRITEHSTQPDHTFVTLIDDTADIFAENETEMQASTMTEAQTQTGWVVQKASAGSNLDS